MSTQTENDQETELQMTRQELIEYIHAMSDAELENIILEVRAEDGERNA